MKTFLEELHTAIDDHFPALEGFTTRVYFSQLVSSAIEEAVAARSAATVEQCAQIADSVMQFYNRSQVGTTDINDRARYAGAADGAQTVATKIRQRGERVNNG